MKVYKYLSPFYLMSFFFLPLAFQVPVKSPQQDAKMDAVIYSTTKADCSGGMLQMGVKNNGTKKINITILKKETTNEFSTTSTIKLSGIPPGYKQVIGCGGKSGLADSLVVIYIVGAASYAN